MSERDKHFTWDMGDLEWEVAEDDEEQEEFSRELTRAERRVDFASIKQQYDRDAPLLVRKLSGAMKDLRDRTIALVERKEVTSDFADSLSVEVDKEFVGPLQAYLAGIWRRNRNLSMAELPPKVQKGLKWLEKYDDEKEYAEKPSDALNWLRNRALIVKGLVDEELTAEVKSLLHDHIESGGTTEETVAKLRDLFEPWVGTGALEPSGTSQTEEDIIRPHRLELIVRMETATAVSQGRAAVAEAADDFVIGYEYSAVLDDRTTETCQLADGLRFRSDDLQLPLPPLHFNCRTVPVFITTDDEPVDWSSDARIAEVLAAIPEEFR